MEVITVVFSNLSEKEKKKMLEVNVDMTDPFTHYFENSMRKIIGKMTPFKDTDIKLLKGSF